MKASGFGRGGGFEGINEYLGTTYVGLSLEDAQPQAVERANASESGLAAYVYTGDVSRVVRVSEGLEFGMVGVNTTQAHVHRVHARGSHPRRAVGDPAVAAVHELGGNAPFIVFEDANLDAAVEGALLAKMRNGGEACAAANRFLAHESVADSFAARLAERMSGMPLGRGTEVGVTVGPLIDAKAQTKGAALVDDALVRGARVACGGETVGEQGYFYAPAVLTEVPADADLIREEIFGPVAALTTFTTEAAQP